MTEKLYGVTTPIGLAWMVRFKSEAAAWRRVCRPQMHKDESEEAAKVRLHARGWRVHKMEPLQNSQNRVKARATP